jgi:hypothetical protein
VLASTRHPNRSSTQQLKCPRNRDVSLSSAGPDLVGDDLGAVGLQVAAHTVGALSPGVLTAKTATSAEWVPNGRHVLVNATATASNPVPTSVDTARYFIGSLSGFALVPTAFNARTIVSVTKFDRKVA